MIPASGLFGFLVSDLRERSACDRLTLARQIYCPAFHCRPNRCPDLARV